MAVTFSLNVTVIIQDRSIYTLKIPTNLPSITFGAFIHHPWVWNVGTKLEIHTPALGASAGCLNDSWHDAKHGHVLYILTLKLPTQSIPGGTLLVFTARETTVAKSVTFRIHFNEAISWGSLSF